MATCKVLLAATLLGLATSAVADFDPDAFPRHETCALCHGLFGTSHTSKFPNLGAQNPSYLTAQLQAFLSGERTNDGGQMSAIVQELQPGDLEQVVEWFSIQEPPEPYDHGDTSQGKEIYATLYCASCHDASEGLQGTPYLTAQHAAYLIKQMDDFLSGARVGRLDVDHGALLPQDASIREAIALYLSSQPRK